MKTELDELRQQRDLARIEAQRLQSKLDLVEETLRKIPLEGIGNYLAQASPGPYREWARPPAVGCIWKDALPQGSFCIESVGSQFALGMIVGATPDRKTGEFFIRARNDLPDIILGIKNALSILS